MSTDHGHPEWRRKHYKKQRKDWLAYGAICLLAAFSVVVAVMALVR